MKKPKSTVEYRGVDSLVELKDNPRKISNEDLEKLKTSLKDNPDYFEARPIILSNRTEKLVVIAGNQRLRAARELGMNEVPTVLLEGLTEEREREIIIRDNVSNGEWNEDLLAKNWNQDLLKTWGAKLNWNKLTRIEDIKEDDAPEVSESEPAKSERGKVYALGGHKLMCGDSTDENDMKKLVGGA